LDIDLTPLTHSLKTLIFIALAAKICCAQEPTFRTEVNLVGTTVLVRSREGVPITDLRRDDFEILEDGVPQKVQFFARERELPLSLALVVDVSGSQNKFLKQHNQDVEKFLTAVLGPVDRALAVCFGNHLRLVSDMTGSVEQIMDGLRSFDAGDRKFPEISERRKLSVVLRRRRGNPPEGLSTDAAGLTARNKYGVRAAKHLSSLTGGAEFDAMESDLGEVFAQIGKELRSLYSIGFVSSNPKHDGSFRKLTIRCRREDTVVRAKSGYYAK
jgi:Ca-activated chloride channel family protein